MSGSLKLLGIVTLSIWITLHSQSWVSGDTSAFGSNLANWTFEDLKNYRHNVSFHKMLTGNCTTFYDVEETIKYMNECTLANEAKDVSPSRTRREVCDLTKSLKSAKGGKGRVKRESHSVSQQDFLPSGIRIRVHNPWRIMESKSVLDFPCIGQCLLEKMTLINEKGEPQNQNILDKVKEVLSVINGTEKQAQKITAHCLKNFHFRMAKVANQTDVTPETVKEEKCKITSRLGLCVARDTYQACRESFIGISSTSRKVKHEK